MEKFPKKVFVKIEGEREDEWFHTEQNADNLDDGNIGIYVLEKIKKKGQKLFLNK